MVERHGLFCSFYTDRGSHYFHTPEAGGKVSRTVLTQVGRALKQLGIEHIAAYSPQARGRSERVFRTLQDRLPKDMVLAGVTTWRRANRWLAETYIAQHNADFAVEAGQEGSGFVPDRAGLSREILCVQEDRHSGQRQHRQVAHHEPAASRQPAETPLRQGQRPGSRIPRTAGSPSSWDPTASPTTTPTAPTSTPSRSPHDTLPWRRFFPGHAPGNQKERSGQITSYEIRTSLPASDMRPLRCLTPEFERCIERSGLWPSLWSLALREIGAFEAKTRLGQLLDWVEAGEDVIITRRRKVVARLAQPVTPRNSERPRDAAQRIRGMRQAVILAGVSLEALIDEGRR